MVKKRILLIVILKASAFIFLWGIQGPSIGMAESDYTVGPGDVLEIKVWDEEDLSRTVKVSEEGSFSFPFVGRIMASGKTIHKIEKTLEKKLAGNYLVAPQVTITMAEYQHQKVFVFGEVKRPGVYMLSHQYNLLELISEAGGFTDKRGATCSIVRPNVKTNNNQPALITDPSANKIIEVDIDNLITGEMNTPPPNVIPGDSVYISEAEKVYVTGEVKSPGAITWKRGMTVREAVSQAGGVTPRAAIKRTDIIRKINGEEKEIRPRLGDVLKPNDIIKVPESYF